jgi:propionate CoA-transferase
LERAEILAQLARAALSWIRRDTSFASPVPDNPKFMSPRAAVELIDDGDVIATSGLGANQRAAIVYAAIRERFEKSGHPTGLTVINLGGGGGRGVVPGTLEELGRPGLCSRLITGHFETFHAMLELADAGQCELQCIPQGTLALLLAGLARGRNTRVSSTGIGTFIDPRVGTGSPVARSTGESMVSVERGRLRYRVPPIDVAVFNAPAADRRGNIYARHSAMLGESREIARAARRNGGRVIANVGMLVEADGARPFIPAHMVDAVVYYPDTEQTAAVFHRAHWPALTTESDVPIAQGLERLCFVNQLAGAARRSAADDVVARLAAATVLANVRRGAYLSIGVGFPEEVGRALFEAGRLDDVTCVVESGVIGGLPAPGIFFGAALCPQRMVSSAELFALCYARLDAACLGVLQADSAGNVNVSKRGPGARGYVGPGGFIDLATAAETIVFASAWMARGDLTVEDESLRIDRIGTAKFVDRVDEITFSGKRAIDAGKRVFFATHVGLFQLTRRGMELVGVMPGIDVARDIVDASTIAIVPPRGRVPVLPRSLFTAAAWAHRAPNWIARHARR